MSWRRSLTARIAIISSCLLAVMAVSLGTFFPRRMIEQERSSAQARAVAIADVMSTAITPAIEFDDPEYAAKILNWLASTPDAVFGVLARTGGDVVAAWQPDRIPAGQVWAAEQRVEFGAEVLVVSMPVHGAQHADAMLHLGFSLAPLAAQRTAATRMVVLVTGAAVVASVLLSLLSAAWLLRPLKRLTATAEKIGSGALPPALPPLPGHDEIAQLAEALRAMLERVHAANQRELLGASRHAGMAEVATGVLHNVGNVLNSVNVSVELLRERLAQSQVGRVAQLRALVAGAGPAGFDGKQLAALEEFLRVVGAALEDERSGSMRDVEALRGHIDHIKRVVAMQNALARRGGVVEDTPLRQLLEEALEIACPRGGRTALNIRVHAAETMITVDRHRVMQILVNLIANARDAVHAGGSAREVAVVGEVIGGQILVRVSDTGVGFSPETGAQLFGAGFTTKPHGHGYGLHSAALSAQLLGGKLTAWSAGQGHGATFTLALPEVAS